MSRPARKLETKLCSHVTIYVSLSELLSELLSGITVGCVETAFILMMMFTSALLPI